MTHTFHLEPNEFPKYRKRIILRMGLLILILCIGYAAFAFATKTPIETTMTAPARSSSSNLAYTALDHSSSALECFILFGISIAPLISGAPYDTL